MNKREQIIRKAVHAYPGGNTVPFDLEKTSLPELVEAAQRYDFGDTLLSFLILELYEELEGEANPHTRAIDLLDRALTDLLSVRNALIKLKGRSKAAPTNPFLFLCTIVRSGIIVSVSLHHSADEAIAEAQICGNNEYRPDYDDIAVLELNLDGSCEDRIYTYEPPFNAEEQS